MGRVHRARVRARGLYQGRHRDGVADHLDGASRNRHAAGRGRGPADRSLASDECLANGRRTVAARDRPPIMADDGG